jgi:hypothetical protein
LLVQLNETAMNVAISTLVADPVLGIDERAAQWLARPENSRRLARAAAHDGSASRRCDHGGRPWTH